ncbi:CBS domain-containing protein [Streptomyces sp. NPDC088915]|uniref:CBS domain-containing protein n=1 Tax=Streptomyces sp. NPDC088915 TaxID=3365912 RepID=UPI00382D60A2
MRHRTVSEVMTQDVVTAPPAAPFKEIVRLLVAHEVSAVPVVDGERRLLGVVSEADLLRGTAELPALEGRWAGVRLLSREYGLPEAETAAGLMTSPAPTAHPDWNLSETARTMHREGVGRLPVTEGAARLVGIVSHRDLLRPFLRDDAEIREEIERDVLSGTLRLARGTVRVSVTNGVVTLTGRVDERADVSVIVRLCRWVDGVVALHESLDHAHGGLARDGLALDVEPPRPERSG